MGKVKTMEVKLAGVSEVSVFAEEEKAQEKFNSTQKVEDVSLDKIKPNQNQPRKDLEANIDKLKDSIEADGLLQPIILAKDTKETHKYIIIAGHRRYKAHQVLQKKTIKAIVKTGTFSDDELDEKALLENLQRENLTTPEIAETLFKLNKDKSFNVGKIEKLTGYKKTQIYGYIKCQEHILDKKITHSTKIAL